MGYKSKNHKCTKEMVERGLKYVNGGYLEEGQAVPTQEGLAIYLDVARATPYNWANQTEYNEFAEDFQYINDRVQAIQGMRIVNGGLTKEFDSGFCGKLAANHGYIDKQAIDHTSSDGSMGPVGKIEIEVIGADSKD